ncbi:hypothetical protein [Streptomyces sp. NBC_00134]|uniref:hypothetical protein n=1 Tax=Streptomyces sp. NBC_00134 TaxID=2975663 RepID=UPI0032532787
MRSSEKHVHGLASAEAHLDEPVWGWRPGLLAVAPLGLAAFFAGDPPVDLLDLLHGDAAGEAQHVEAGRAGWGAAGCAGEGLRAEVFGGVLCVRRSLRGRFQVGRVEGE